MNTFFKTLEEECQRIGCHFNPEVNDLFEHLSQHRTLLLDRHINIAHEIGEVKTDISHKGLGTVIQTLLSQQDITPLRTPPCNGFVASPPIRNLFDFTGTSYDCTLTFSFKSDVRLQSINIIGIQTNTLRGGMNSNESSFNQDSLIF